MNNVQIKIVKYLLTFQQTEVQNLLAHIIL